MLGQLDRELERKGRQDSLIARLMTAPGVGAQTAFAFTTFVGEIQRFPSAKHLASYFGLVPRVRASGDHCWTGAITKESERMMRWLLIEAAGQAARQPGPLREYYRRMVNRKGKSKARVALAHKLVGVLFHLWKQDLTYFEFLCRGAARFLN
jgi:transposase